MPNSSSAAAPIVQLSRLLNEFYTPTSPRDRLQDLRLRSQILRAADRSTFDALLCRAHQFDDPILQSLTLVLAGEQRLLLRYLLTSGYHDNVTPMPQDAAMIKSLTTSVSTLSKTIYQCLEISEAHRAFRKRP